MSPPFLQMHPSIPTPASSTLSFSSQIVPDPTHLFLTSSFSHLSIANPPKSTTIRMGGGPRTYPGGVSKWQWKRMQAKKAKQLLRARLARERQIYEMRKRAELSAAVSELERPWEVVEQAPKLFSTSADEQLKVLADRFQKPGGFDLWSEKDGPQLFETVEGVPSARFFPKGVVHSIKPYGRITDGCSSEDSDLGQRDFGNEKSRSSKKNNMGIGDEVSDQDLEPESGLIQLMQMNWGEENSRNKDWKFMKKDGRRSTDGYSSEDSDLVQRDFGNEKSRNSKKKDMGIGDQVYNQDLDPESGLIQLMQRNSDEGNSRNKNGKFMKKDGRRRSTDEEKRSNWKGKGRNGVFDMSLQEDGSYGILKTEKMRQRTERK